jgi:hypothetical protein
MGQPVLQETLSQDLLQKSVWPGSKEEVDKETRDTGSEKSENKGQGRSRDCSGDE